jgi:Flp pilus assembly protein TadD
VLEERPDSVLGCQIMAELRLKQCRYDESMGWIQRARDIERNHPRSLDLLGRVLEHRGDMPGAEAAFRQAVEVDPEYADALAHLGQLLLNTDRRAEAEQCFRTAISHDRDHGLANLLLGGILYEQRRPDLAVPHLQTGIQRQLTSRSGQFTLAFALHELGRLDEAVTAFRRLIAAGDLDPRIYSGLAAVLEELGELEGAMAGYEAALELAPDHAFASAGSAGIMTLCGEAAQALTVLEPWVERGDAAPCLQIAYARALRATGRENEPLLRLTELVERPAPDVELIPAFQLLGELLDARGEFDRAFAQFHRAKQLTSGRYDAPAHEALVTRMINTFTRELLDQLPCGSVSDVPVFIVGMPRSGSSVIEQIIAAHPYGIGVGSLPHVELCAGRIGRYNNMGFGYPECIHVLRERDLRELSSFYLAQVFNQSSGPRRAADSMWLNYFHLGLIERMFPNARVVHCRRSPLATGLGAYSRSYPNPGQPFANELASFGHYYAQYQRLMAHWRATTILPILELDFEALLRDQEGETRRLLEFLGLPWDPSCLAFYQHEGLVRSSQPVRLRRALEPRELGWAGRYERHLGPLREGLAAAGYPVD